MVSVRWSQLFVGPLRTPQTHIQSAGAAVTDVRVFESDHQRAEFAQREPERHLPFEHAALVRLAAFACSLAGDHKYHSHAVRLCAPQEAQQGGMRLRLGEAMQIKPRIDRFVTTRDPLLKSSPELRERWGIFSRSGFVRRNR